MRIKRSPCTERHSGRGQRQTTLYIGSLHTPQAATIQVLKDRDYVRTEKNRFFAEESGRLLTASKSFHTRYLTQQPVRSRWHYLGIAFYVWLGVYALTSVAQIWS